MPLTAMSRHLRLLRSSGLVTVATPEDDARARVYSLGSDGLTALRAWLDQIEASWREQLASFKTHAERSRGRR